MGKRLIIENVPEGLWALISTGSSDDCPGGHLIGFGTIKLSAITIEDTDE